MIAAIETARLRLIPGTVELLDAFLEDRGRLAARLGVAVPPDFPVFPEGIRFGREALAADAANVGWAPWFFVARAGRVVIGDGGFKGPPLADGSVEIGYALTAAYRRQGYGLEAVGGLVEWAFGHPEVREVRAETLPDNAASIALLRRLGMRRVGEGEDGGSGWCGGRSGGEACPGLRAGERAREHPSRRTPTGDRPPLPGVPPCAGEGEDVAPAAPCLGGCRVVWRSARDILLAAAVPLRDGRPGPTADEGRLRAGRGAPRRRRGRATIMDAGRGQPHLLRPIGRALLLRRPRCGGRGLLKNWFNLQERCPVCGLVTNRGSRAIAGSAASRPIS